MRSPCLSPSFSQQVLPDRWMLLDKLQEFVPMEWENFKEFNS